MDEIDIWRVADLLVKECGDEAVSRASQRADALLDQGDTREQCAIGRAIPAPAPVN